MANAQTAIENCQSNSTPTYAEVLFYALAAAIMSP